MVHLSNIPQVLYFLQKTLANYYQKKGYNVNVYYLRKDDAFVEIKPYSHTFNIKPKANLTKKIENGKAVNDVLFTVLKL